MTTLITGGSKCGKSRYGEKILDNFRGRKIYIATMQPFGEEAHEAIARHRLQRHGKAFNTLEIYRDLHKTDLPEHCGVLLECLGNLCANEMFSGGEISRTADRIINGIQHISLYSDELVLITNQVSCDGISYPQGTSDYISVLSEINRRAAEISDCVIECVYGIPVILKGELPC